PFASPRQRRREGRGGGRGGAGPCRWPSRTAPRSRIELRVTYLAGGEAPSGRTPGHGQRFDVSKGRSLVEIARKLLDHVPATLDAHANPPVLQVHDVAAQPELRRLSMREVSVPHSVHMPAHDDLSCTLWPRRAHGMRYG